MGPTIANMGQCLNSTNKLQQEARVAPAPLPDTLTVRLISPVSCVLSASPDSSVGQLLAVAAVALGLRETDWSQLVLVFCDEEIVDVSLTLHSIGLREGAEVSLLADLDGIRAAAAKEA